MKTSQNSEVFEGVSTLLVTNFQVRSVFFRDTYAGVIEVHTRKDALFPPVSEMNFLSYTKEAFQAMISRNPQALLVKLSSSRIACSRTTSQDAIRNALKLDLIYPEVSREPEQGFFGRIFSCIWEEDPLPLPTMKRASRPALHLPSEVIQIDEWESDIFDNQDFVEVDIPSTPATSRIDRLLDYFVCSTLAGICYPVDARIPACATTERFIVNHDMLLLRVSSAVAKYLITLAEFKNIQTKIT